ncbi:MAG: DUF1634 domain-containing protein [Phycisphaeraceae bacterium]|nr:DUF1634 domain-containing protein [Phycisphaeraceae bacterium]
MTDATNNAAGSAAQKPASGGAPLHKHDLEASLATLLTAGTALAAVVLCIGGAVYLSADYGKKLDFRTFEPSAHGSVFSVFQSAFRLDGAALMQLGVVLLILTPVARVFFTLVAFLFRRDWMYVVVTVIVLSVLIYGLLGSAQLH